MSKVCFLVLKVEHVIDTHDVYACRTCLDGDSSGSRVVVSVQHRLAVLMSKAWFQVLSVENIK